MEIDDTIRREIHRLLTTNPKRAHEQRVRNAGIWARPHHSDALGVNPSQISEATAALRARGVTADFDSEGRCIVTSEKQFKEVARSCGLFNNRDGFGIPTPDGTIELSGRRNEIEKQEWKRRILREEGNLSEP